MPLSFRFRKTAVAGLLVAVLATAALGAASAPAAAPRKNIVQTAIAAGAFKTLVALVTKAGLASALSGPGPLTVFAPTDAAFAKVPKATLDALAHDPTKLKAVLLYHVVRGKFTAARIEKRKALKTLEGASVRIRVSGGNVFVNRAQVIKANIAASNGVIHVIDRVLIPSG